MRVPFLDLRLQYESIKGEIGPVLQKVLEECAFAGGAFVEEFEKEFARFCRTEYAVGVGSGTEALWLALLVSGVGPGDEVITVPNTFMATAEAISLCGAKPVFVDIEEAGYGMNPALLAAAITPRTKAIVPVHLFGQMADMDPILEIARGHGLPVVEDACQAHGAEYKGKRAGSLGTLGCFSFYPGKNLGAYGEAGAIVTNDPLWNEKLRMLRDHGQAGKYQHRLVGANCRMDGIQGAVLAVKLKHLPDWNLRRREHARAYHARLAPLGSLSLPEELPYRGHVYHVYAVRSPKRDALIAGLGQRGIHCGIHYPVPLHLQEAYGFLGLREGAFPVAEKVARELFSLPMYPELRPEQIAYVADQIAALLP
jgi:dTDP-4-amino-4,6-dideoxygalactose transaminase